jgi:hypothetical protein
MHCICPDAVRITKRAEAWFGRLYMRQHCSRRIRQAHVDRVFMAALSLISALRERHMRRAATLSGAMKPTRGVPPFG